MVEKTNSGRSEGPLIEAMAEIKLEREELQRRSKSGFGESKPSKLFPEFSRIIDAHKGIKVIFALSSPDVSIELVTEKSFRGKPLYRRLLNFKDTNRGKDVKCTQ
ncbi:uncharacterized protein LOC143894378 [Temnothorax americanus]|uniref:uncharacterized protein LOC143894378 n=1 Tax=Temnothorax americanus TaxID=1964332 RepID=UPI0040678AB7